MKPPPALEVAICELMPTTRPSMSSSGPPELPWFTAASVWITSSIGKPLGAVIRRCLPDTMPAVIVSSRPSGLPSASTRSPTLTRLELAGGSGVSSASPGST